MKFRSRFHAPYCSQQILVGLACIVGMLYPMSVWAVDLEVATFQIDATPPVGSPLCDALVPPSIGVDDPLSVRGIVLLPADQPAIVLVAVDWVGIGNGGQDAWRQALSKAAETSPDRVCVHALHQHDAPGCDFTAEEICADHELQGQLFPVDFARQTILLAAQALVDAVAQPQRVTHIGMGQAKVEKVASNRRILGADGKVQHVRYSSCPDPAIRALPEGTIDPWVKLVSFWNDQEPLVAVSYYATHPQSYYRTGLVSADFVGMARSEREKELPNTPHIHFNGAGGNIGAGKYNDGSQENRPLLAKRLADGAKAAWEATEKTTTDDLSLSWQTRQVDLPVAAWLTEADCRERIADKNASQIDRLAAIRDLAWWKRCQAAGGITIGRLRLGKLDILHLPGELFVEYQLAAQRMRPESFVCTAAYGDYGPGYIGLAEAYSQGGYETGRVSRVSPRVEVVLMKAIQELMQ